ncbi:putative nucleolar complex protein 14 [Teratosphaeria destructans]|uniref:Nucleolar complex protein 14 n=1 Tax=Teratosphaeria destructans TaxID=418781 RepID=A0A9W7VXU6_9PEZI|nr:putative nucleolar complex protein 14 [Teratosphaeria destructans]
MPPSQLKRLKTSLREQGITGPPKSKKQKRAPKSASHHQDRHAALQQIRDSFNPFELRPGNARPAKFESAAAKSGNRYKNVLHRPGVSKSAGEEMRRKNLLPEMQRRNKVGGLLDRRIGEGDPGMTAEERAVQRFAREKRGNVFGLEGSDDEGGKMGLTHLGRPLIEDDFAEAMINSEDSGSEDGFLRKKRRRDSEEDQMDGGAESEAEDHPERKKTKKEVMQEVIAKSKLHKYERQKVKEDDDDLREELDKGMAGMLALLHGHKPMAEATKRQAEAALNGDSQGPKIDPGRQALLDGMDRAQADREYEKRLKQFAQDTRAAPSNRTKTAEEKAKDEAERLRKLEEKRSSRMRGEQVSDDEAESDDANVPAAANGIDAFGNDEALDEAEEFGFTTSAPRNGDLAEEKFTHVDEDEFDFDEDLVASDPELSDVELSEDESGSDEEDEAEAEAARDNEEDDEFVKGILGDEPSAASATGANATTPNRLAYTYPCPRSHDELLDVVKNVAVEQIPIVVQRIRALYHPSLSASNKECMADFTAALVDHISHMADEHQSLAIVEQLIRHLHSLSRTYPIEIATAFRNHLHVWHEREGGQPSAGDLVILTAIGSIYPTSDHFHQVVTPAITLMSKWLNLNAPETAEQRTTGAFLIALALNYQRLSKRYIPEAVRFTIRTLSHQPGPWTEEQRPHLDNLLTMADLWKSKSAFAEIFTHALPMLKQIKAKREYQHIQILLTQSLTSRRPLELHHHKKQPIRSSIPKFEEGFNPDKHYDPDKERSEAKKLQKEFKREKKGAMRELRKDANFIARESLREKRERDAEYERKQRRLIAEIQGEEGHERKEYEREIARRRREKVRK